MSDSEIPLLEMFIRLASACSLGFLAAMMTAMSLLIMPVFGHVTHQMSKRK